MKAHPSNAAQILNNQIEYCLHNDADLNGLDTKQLQEKSGETQ